MHKTLCNQGPVSPDCSQFLQRPKLCVVEEVLPSALSVLIPNGVTSPPPRLPHPHDAGSLPKPSHWATSGPIITMGSSVTIWCQGSPQADTYWLYKEGVTQYWDKWAPWNYVDTVSFRIEFMNTGHARQFQCAYQSSSGWSGWIGPLLLVMTGAYSKPSLSAHPSPLVVSGGSVSLSCSSKDRTDTFYLQHSPIFTLDHMNHTHKERYRCYGACKLFSGWLAPSDPRTSWWQKLRGGKRGATEGQSLVMVVTSREVGTGQLPVQYDHLLSQEHITKPSPSAHPGPSVASGDSVTLQCRSDQFFDTFHLFKEGLIVPPPQRLHWQKNAGPFQANFTMSLMTSTHGGTYRCYSSHSTSPYLLSQPSEPLELVVSDNLTHAQGLPQYLKVLIGVLVAFVLLLVLFLLLFLLIRHHRQGKGNAAVRDKQPEKEMELDSQSHDRHFNFTSFLPLPPPKKTWTEGGQEWNQGDQSPLTLSLHQRPKDENSQGRMCTQVTHHSRPRQGVATFPSSLFGELQDMKDRQVEEDSQRDSQAAAPEDPQDVTYVELNHPTQRRETTAPCSSQSGELSNDPILYAAVAIHYPRTRPRPQSPSRGPVKTQKATELPP
nr:leukocyte immunoglobulin-like receptor subfamily B member 3 [Loxodonta africana]